MVKALSYLRMVLLSSLFGVCGCSLGSLTSEELRASPGEASQFRVATPYPAVFANFNGRASDCFNGGTRGAYYYVENRELGPGAAGRVEVILGGLWTRVMLSADIREAPGGTEISYYVN